MPSTSGIVQFPGTFGQTKNVLDLASRSDLNSGSKGCAVTPLLAVKTEGAVLVSRAPVSSPSSSIVAVMQATQPGSRSDRPPGTGNSPQSYTQNNYQFLDNITIVRGAHVFKFGTEWRHWIAPTDFLPRSRGEWDYTSLQTLIDDRVPDGFNGALRGAGSGTFSGNQDGIYWFVQDD